MPILIIFFIHDVNTCLADANGRPSGGLHRCRILVLFPIPLKPVPRDFMTRSWAEHGSMGISAFSISLGRPIWSWRQRRPDNSIGCCVCPLSCDQIPSNDAAAKGRIDHPRGKAEPSGTNRDNLGLMLPGLMLP